MQHLLDKDSRSMMIYWMGERIRVHFVMRADIVIWVQFLYEFGCSVYK